MHYELKRDVAVSAVISLPFECMSCRHRAKATVFLEKKHTVTERVEARDAYALPVLREASSSTGEPSPAMQLEARDLVALAPCPSCGRRDARALRASSAKAWGCSLVIAAVPLGLGIVVGRSALSPTVGVVIGLVGALVALFIVVVAVGVARKTAADAVKKVRFDAP